MELKDHPDHVIPLGDGRHILARGTRGGLAVLFIEPTDNPKPAGTMTGNETNHPHGNQLAVGTTAITFTSRGSLDALILTLQELRDSPTGK